MSGTGCSAYSSPTADSRVRAATAAGTSQPPLASTRMAASGSASRTASTRAASSARVCPGSATLILTASTRPKRARMSGTRSAATAGTVALTGMLVRSGAGKPSQPASMAASEPAGGLHVAVFGEGAELGPAQRAIQQQGLALEDAAELHPHGQAHHMGAGEELVQLREPHRLSRAVASGNVQRRDWWGGHEFTVPGVPRGSTPVVPDTSQGFMGF